MTYGVVITVNGAKFEVQAKQMISFSEIVALAKMSGQPSMTVQYRGGPSRIVAPSESVMPMDGMIFNVSDTSNA